MIRAVTKTVRWIVSFVFGAVAALTLSYTVLAGYTAYAQNQKALSGEPGAETELGEPTGLGNWWRTQNDLNEQFSTTHLTSRRALQLRTIVPYDTLLDEGEPLPDPAFADLYATARAPRVLMSFCEELLQSVANRCQLVGVESRVDDDGHADIRASFYFVPDAAPGNVPDLAEGEIQSFRINLTRLDRIPDTRAMRLQALAGAEKLCDTLRASVQNCVISHLYFSPDTRRGSDEELLEAQVVLAAYADLSEEDKKDVMVSLREQAIRLFP